MNWKLFCVSGFVLPYLVSFFTLFLFRDVFSVVAYNENPNKFDSVTFWVGITLHLAYIVGASIFIFGIVTKFQKSIDPSVFKYTTLTCVFLFFKYVVLMASSLVLYINLKGRL